MRVEKLIGFDATEDKRAKGGGGTYATGKLNLCPEKGIPSYADRYDVRYPLREQGITRSMCRDIIVGAGLPIPPKSACFFCPASQAYEIQRLAQVDPAYYCLSIAMEVLYRKGKHYRGDNSWTVKAKRKDTGEKETFECFAQSSSDALMQFRLAYKDTARPYRYKLTASRAVGGLDFGKPWMLVPATLPDLYRGRLERFLEIHGHELHVDNMQLPVLQTESACSG